MALVSRWAPLPDDISKALYLWGMVKGLPTPPPGPPPPSELLPAAVAGPFFERSSLPREILLKIWALADGGDKGALNFMEFALSCRLSLQISMAQANAEISDATFLGLQKMTFPPPSLGLYAAPAPQPLHYGYGYPPAMHVPYGMPHGGAYGMAPPPQHHWAGPTSVSVAPSMYSPGTPVSPAGPMYTSYPPPGVHAHIPSSSVPPPAATQPVPATHPTHSPGFMPAPPFGSFPQAMPPPATTHTTPATMPSVLPSHAFAATSQPMMRSSDSMSEISKSQVPQAVAPVPMSVQAPPPAQAPVLHNPSALDAADDFGEFVGGNEPPVSQPNAVPAANVPTPVVSQPDDDFADFVAVEATPAPASVPPPASSALSKLEDFLDAKAARLELGSTPSSTFNARVAMQPLSAPVGATTTIQPPAKATSMAAAHPSALDDFLELIAPQEVPQPVKTVDVAPTTTTTTTHTVISPRVSSKGEAFSAPVDISSAPPQTTTFKNGDGVVQVEVVTPAGDNVPGIRLTRTFKIPSNNGRAATAKQPETAIPSSTTAHTSVAPQQPPPASVSVKAAEIPTRLMPTAQDASVSKKPSGTDSPSAVAFVPSMLMKDFLKPSGSVKQEETDVKGVAPFSPADASSLIASLPSISSLHSLAKNDEIALVTAISSISLALASITGVLDALNTALTTESVLNAAQQAAVKLRIKACDEVVTQVLCRLDALPKTPDTAVLRKEEVQKATALGEQIELCRAIVSSMEVERATTTNASKPSALISEDLFSAVPSQTTKIEDDFAPFESAPQYTPVAPISTHHTSQKAIPAAAPLYATPEEDDFAPFEAAVSSTPAATSTPVVTATSTIPSIGISQSTTSTNKKGQEEDFAPFESAPALLPPVQAPVTPANVVANNPDDDFADFESATPSIPQAATSTQGNTQPSTASTAPVVVPHDNDDFADFESAPTVVPLPSSSAPAPALNASAGHSNAPSVSLAALLDDMFGDLPDASEPLPQLLQTVDIPPAPLPQHNDTIAAPTAVLTTASTQQAADDDFAPFESATTESTVDKKPTSIPQQLPLHDAFAAHTFSGGGVSSGQSTTHVMNSNTTTHAADTTIHDAFAAHTFGGSVVSNGQSTTHAMNSNATTHAVPPQPQAVITVPVVAAAPAHPRCVSRYPFLKAEHIAHSMDFVYFTLQQRIFVRDALLRDYTQQREEADKDEEREDDAVLFKGLQTSMAKLVDQDADTDWAAKHTEICANLRNQRILVAEDDESFRNLLRACAKHVSTHATDAVVMSDEVSEATQKLITDTISVLPGSDYTDMHSVMAADISTAVVALPAYLLMLLLKIQGDKNPIVSLWSGALSNVLQFVKQLAAALDMLDKEIKNADTAVKDIVNAEWPTNERLRACLTALPRYCDITLRIARTDAYYNNRALQKHVNGIYNTCHDLLHVPSLAVLWNSMADIRNSMMSSLADVQRVMNAAQDDIIAFHLSQIEQPAQEVRAWVRAPCTVTRKKRPESIAPPSLRKLMSLIEDVAEHGLTLAAVCKHQGIRNAYMQPAASTEDPHTLPQHLQRTKTGDPWLTVFKFGE